MSLPYIRDAYRVPAWRGVRVKFAPPNAAAREAIITGSRNAHIRCKWVDDPGGHSVSLHPTWCIEYLSYVPNDQAQARAGRSGAKA